MRREVDGRQNPEMGGRAVGGTERLVERKVRGGKLFRLRVAFIGDRPGKVVLTGDFFLEPEEGIDALEAALLSAYLAPDPKTAGKIIDVASNGLMITGFSTGDLVDALEEAGGCRGG